MLRRNFIRAIGYTTIAVPWIAIVEQGMAHGHPGLAVPVNRGQIRRGAERPWVTLKARA